MIKYYYDFITNYFSLVISVLLFNTFENLSCSYINNVIYIIEI